MIPPLNNEASSRLRQTHKNQCCIDHLLDTSQCSVDPGPVWVLFADGNWLVTPLICPKPIKALTPLFSLVPYNIALT
jgi:hypothetical protein